MPNLLVAGDIHGDIIKFYDFLLKWQDRTACKIDGVIHVGDFGVYPSLDFGKYWEGKIQAPFPTWVCPGNHESWPALHAWLGQPNRIPNMHLLMDGGITDVLGVRVGAIWGNFSWKSWQNEERIKTARRNALLDGRTGPKSMHIRRTACEQLQQAGLFDILITHDAPAQLMPMNRTQPPDFIKQVLGLDVDEKAQGCPGFNEVYLSGKPKLHYFGHFHKLVTCQLSDPRVVALHCFNYSPDESIEMVRWEDGSYDLGTGYRPQLLEEWKPEEAR